MKSGLVEVCNVLFLVHFLWESKATQITLSPFIEQKVTHVSPSHVIILEPADWPMYKWNMNSLCKGHVTYNPSHLPLSVSLSLSLSLYIYIYTHIWACVSSYPYLCLVQYACLSV